jgi:hypothetical protein
VVGRLTEVIHDDWEHSRLLDVDERAVESGEEREFEAQLTKADSMLDFAKRDQITLLVRGDQSVLRARLKRSRTSSQTHAARDRQWDLLCDS